MSSSSAPPRFAAFQHSSYRLFWSGNLVSTIGAIAQQTALGWLARSLTSDPRFITFIAVCSWIPMSVLFLYTGAVADRVDKRRALIWTNGFTAIAAVALGTLVYSGLIQLWHVIAMAAAMGVVAAFDTPIRQSFNVEMVGRGDLASAIALNSSAHHVARIAGPAVGGLLIHAVSLASCFLINALSFTGIMLALALMRMNPNFAQAPAGVAIKGAARWRGVLFVKRHTTLRLLFVMLAVVSFMAVSFSAPHAGFCQRCVSNRRARIRGASHL